VNDPQNPRSPAFQWYPNDFMGDVNVQLMDWTQRGIYVWLIGLCWLQKSIPSDIGSLAKITNTSITYWEEFGSNILCCFKVSKDGKLIHNRVEREREKQRAYKEKKHLAGEIGAKNRWNKYNKANKLHASAILLPLANDGSSSSISSSTAAIPPLSPVGGINIYKTKPQKRCPENFVISEDMRKWAKAKFPRVKLEDATESFMDHEFKLAHKDWIATWRQWIRNADKFSPNNNGHKEPGSQLLTPEEKEIYRKQGDIWNARD
jgi:uncharacterized protein YdaU (DUF1376 family)